MRRTRILPITALLLGAPVWVAAQAARPATGAPEFTLSASAQAKNATGAVSGYAGSRLDSYTPDYDRKTVEEALRLGGYPRFVTSDSERAPRLVNSCSQEARRTSSDPVCTREGRGWWPHRFLSW